MANSLYITPTTAGSGKTVIALGMMQLLLKDIRTVAFFRPIISLRGKGPVNHDAIDNDINLMCAHFSLGLRYEHAYAYTMDDAKRMINSGRRAEMMENILARYKYLEANYRFVLCEGTDFAAGHEAFEFDINSEIMADLGCPALVVAGGQDRDESRDVCQVAGDCRIFVERLEKRGVDVLGVLVNRADPDSLGAVRVALAQALEKSGCLTYALPEVARLARPRVRDVQQHFNARVLFGKEAMDKQVDDYLIAAMMVPDFLDHIHPHSLVVSSGDRSGIILAGLATRFAASYPDISGIMITGEIPVPDNLMRLIKDLKGAALPIIQTPEPPDAVAAALGALQGRIRPDTPKRIALALGTFEAHVNVREMRKRIAVKKSVRITPQMFEYSLIEKAKADRQHIVLPEGTGERILRAADILLRRSFCDITLLGREKTVRQTAAELGLNISAANVVDPADSPLTDDYAATLYELRKEKGVNRDMARDMIMDPAYFGTMMVHKGDADGMVSGSITTTAHTIRPAFQIIKTRPGASVVSSAFLMCLKDRVLVFGDCAINPNPTAEQLAEIAISSAQTATVFGIAPRVAMLSYSTGSSGTGADVEKVARATALVKDAAPDLLIEGPIQYDAAIAPDVAKTKLPGSQVAGKATVFIFPDLNTGNNTYKAVQRASETTLAIGPVLQGLNKPVNDLSRGCTVPDIINTVAITAIQAQTSE